MQGTEPTKPLLNSQLNSPKKYSEAGNIVAPFTARVIWTKKYAVANGKNATVTWRCDLTAEEYSKLIKPTTHELYALWIKFKMYERNIYQVQFFDNLKAGGFAEQCIYHQRIGIPAVTDRLSEYLDLKTGDCWKKITSFLK